MPRKSTMVKKTAKSAKKPVENGDKENHVSTSSSAAPKRKMAPKTEVPAKKKKQEVQQQQQQPRQQQQKQPRAALANFPLTFAGVYPNRGGVALCVGTGDAGQLGLGEDIVERKRPALVKNLADVAAIAAGGMHSVALTLDGKVCCECAVKSGNYDRPQSIVIHLRPSILSSLWERENVDRTDHWVIIYKSINIKMPQWFIMSMKVVWAIER